MRLIDSDYKDLVMTQKQQLDDTEDKYLEMKRDLESKSKQLENLSLINKDIMEKANIARLDVLEMELKSKESQLTLLTSRLDEKQKEYANKLEQYQHIFNEQRSRHKELEDENYELRQKLEGDSKKGSSKHISSEETEKLSQQISSLQTELKQEKEKCRKLHEEFFKEKDRSMHSEIKISDLERKNLDLQLKVSDLESKVEELEAHTIKLEVAEDH